MQVESFAIRLRTRGHWEAADLGVRLCQREWRSVYGCFWLAYLPIVVLSLASFEYAEWLPTVVLWWAKPWLDRSILFALSRAAFGLRTTPLDLWHAQRDVWWRQLLGSLTLRRLSPWRSLTQPVHQLEGLTWSARRQRAALIRKRHAGTGFLLMNVFGSVEMVLMFALISLFFWFAPAGYEPDWTLLYSGQLDDRYQFVLAVCYALVIGFLEPFYVASGFAMYLNRRVELEAWDIEQEFRRAFA